MLSVVAALVLQGCDPTQSVSGTTMGSSYQIKFISEDHSSAQIRSLAEKVFKEMDHLFSRYQANTVIEQFNASRSGTCVNVPEDFLKVIEYGLHLSKQSKGTFDITIRPLIDLWSSEVNGEVSTIPDKAKVHSARLQVGYAQLTVKNNQLCKKNNITLDMDALVAGFAVDRLVDVLREAGVSSALVEVTGEIKAYGLKEDKKPWYVGIEAPFRDIQKPFETLSLNNMAVATAGDYRQFRMFDKTRISQMINPHKGMPIQQQLTAVTVVNASALHADGLATMLYLMGTESGLAYCKKHQIAALFVERRDAQSKSDQEDNALDPTHIFKKIPTSAFTELIQLETTSIPE